LKHIASLLESRQVDIVSVSHLPVSHPLYEAIKAEGLEVRRDLHWRLDLEPWSFEKTISRFSKKHRYNIRRADRILAEHFHGDVALRVFTGEHDVCCFLAGAAAIT